MSTSKDGMTMTASHMVRMTASIQPPLKPARNPNVIPTNRPMPAAMKPTIRERGVPVIRTASMSRPLLSVPSGWAGSGGGNPSGCAQIGGRFSGDDATRASVTSQNSGPIRPSSTAKPTMHRPAMNLLFSHGLSKRFSRLAFLGVEGAFAVVAVMGLSQVARYTFTR